MEEFRLPLVVLSLPEPSAALNRWRAAYRQGWGAETLEVGTDQFSFVDISRQLAHGKCVAMLMDRPHSNGEMVFADFPHGRVPFSTGPVWLSLLTGAPLVAVKMLATESGNYALEALPPLRWQWHGPDRAATVREYTLELASRFREPLCNHPDQWYQFVPLSRLYSSASA
jgi:lauroyl/myristoyl acyltransferase